MFREVFRLRRRWRQAPPAELRGRPTIRREKIYAADSGYVYQYTYEGYRPAIREEVEGREFVFGCTSDRASRFNITVFAPAESFADWERRFDRELNQVERYAIIKMRLFEIFDEFERIASDLDEVLSAEQVERQVEALDL
jgi:hypothetical protein